MLGTYWTRESVQALTSPEDPRGRREPRSSMMLPLLLGMKPQLEEFLVKSFGNNLGISAPDWYREDQGEVVEGFDMPRDEFIQLASMFTGVIPKPTT